MDWHSLFWADELFAPQGKLATIWFDKLVLQNTGEDSLEGAINILRETEQFSDATAETLKTIWVPVQTLIPNWAAGNSELLRSSPEDIRETVTTALKKRIRKEYGADFAETGFLIFNQRGERPARYDDPSRSDTMPSQVSARAYL
jgi:hypothetical protein